MITSVYQLIEPRSFSVKFEDTPIEGRVVVRPQFMSICHADQRYYRGLRPPQVLARKLPMALIHECCGEVVYDPTGKLPIGQRVVMIPNVASDASRDGQTSTGVYENYAKGSYFLSSGHDGFMREVCVLPERQLVAFDDIPLEVAAITEFVSVVVHAVTRFLAVSLPERSTIAIFGDGSMGYAVACVLDALLPTSDLIVFGHHPEKLSLFSFVSKTCLSTSIPEELSFDHAFECVGSAGSASAIDAIIDHANPQATLMLLGVSESPVPVRTRDVMEKGMTIVGCSRSGRADFQKALELMKDEAFQQRLKRIIFLDDPVYSLRDAARVFATDRETPFKTVFEWNV